MNVGIVADCYQPTISGVVSSILQLKAGLAQRGHRAVILTVDTPGCEEQDPAVHFFPSLPFNTASNFRLGLVNPWAVSRIVRREKLDLIHTHTEFSLGWSARFAARKLGLPLVHTAHTLYQAYQHYLVGSKLLPAGVLQGFLSRFFSGCDLVVCPSSKMQAYIDGFASQVPTVVVGNGVRKGRFRPDLSDREKARTRQGLGVRAGDWVLMYVGRIGPEKRVSQLLAALRPLLHGSSRYKLVLVGGGPSLRRLKKWVRENGLAEQVIFTGPVAWERMPRLYAVAQVLVTASLSEVHPLTLIEAAMCGLPSVVRRDDAYADLVKDGYNGYQVDTDAEIPRRVADILEDEAERRRLARNALALSEPFSAQTHLDRLESLYRRLLRGRPPSARV